MKVSVPSGLRLAMVAPHALRPTLPLHATWADVRMFETDKGWGKALRAASLTRPDVTFCVLDEHFEPSAAASVGGLKVGLISRPPFGANGPWPVDQWRSALDAVTWYEPPPPGFGDPDAIVPLPVDRARLGPPDFTKRRIVVPRWAAPSASILERLSLMEELVLLEPQASLEHHLELLDSGGVFITVNYDATGRLDPLPLQALARGLLVVATTAFPPLWGIEPEDDFLVRPEDKILATVDEYKRIPDTARLVRMRAFQKAAEFFDADQVFQRLLVDVLMVHDAARLPALASQQQLRSVR